MSPEIGELVAKIVYNKKHAGCVKPIGKTTRTFGASWQSRQFAFTHESDGASVKGKSGCYTFAWASFRGV